MLYRVFLLLLLLPATAGSTQSIYQVSSPVPVVFGKKDDGYPEKLEVVGRITDVSFSRACGVIFWSGTIKIKLIEKIPGYPHQHVFVVVNCLEDSMHPKRYFGQDVRLEVSKLYPELKKHDPPKFFFELIDNTINSRGVPFYYTNLHGESLASQ